MVSTRVFILLLFIDFYEICTFLWNIKKRNCSPGPRLFSNNYLKIFNVHWTSTHQSHFYSIKIFHDKIIVRISALYEWLLCKSYSTIEIKIASSCEVIYRFILFICLSVQTQNILLLTTTSLEFQPRQKKSI